MLHGHLGDDVLSLDFILGDNSRYNFDYYIDKGFYWSVGMNSRYIGFTHSTDPSGLINTLNYPSVDKIQMSFSDFAHQFFVETLIKKDLALKIGLEFKNLKITTTDNSFLAIFDNAEYKFEDSNFFSGFGSLKIDTIDNKYLPTSGFLFEGGFQYYFASSNSNGNFNDFSIVKSQMSKAFKITNQLSLNIGTEGGFILGDSSTKALHFGLGGYGQNYFNNFSSFYGYDYLALIGDSFVKADTTVDYEIIKNHHFNISVALLLFERGANRGTTSGGDKDETPPRSRSDQARKQKLSVLRSLRRCLPWMHIHEPHDPTYNHV